MARLSAGSDAWTRAGCTVIGCALAARAAQQLQADSAVPSVTLDRLLIELDRTDTPNLTPSTVVVADEAAMIGTRKLARLLDHAHEARAKVALVGDPRQLPEIEAGGAFTALAARLGASTLVENRRQQDPIERRALAELRAGHVDLAIDRLAEHGHVTEIADRHDAYRQMVDGWYGSIQRGETAVMLALHRSDADALNHLARQALDAGGHYEHDRTTIGGREYAVGDWVMTRRNDRNLRVINGQSGKVFSVNDDETLTVVFNDSPHFRDIRNAYIEAGDLDYPYAMTVHKSQGLTCDRAYVLGRAGRDAEAGYTALSRGRLENHLYVTKQDLETDHHDTTPPDEPIDEIRDALRRSAREPLAVDASRTMSSSVHETNRSRHLETVDQSAEVDDGLGW
jgi:ATP-dependent exoDNAse (exonuclease V) alpha subunit